MEQHPLSNIFNIDQTLLQFEMPAGKKTYICMSGKNVHIKIAWKGWTMLQATVILLIFTDCIFCCIPLIIFDGTGKPTTRLLEEM